MCCKLSGSRGAAGKCHKNLPREYSFISVKRKVDIDTVGI